MTWHWKGFMRNGNMWLEVGIDTHGLQIKEYTSNVSLVPHSVFVDTASMEEELEYCEVS